MRIAATILVVALALLQNSKVSSFEINTHRALSDRAAVGSTLNDFLISQLGLSGGINETLSDGTVTRTVTQWIQEGSDREDAGFRFFNHFHNPLRTWDRAGLRILGAQLGFSSVLWGQRTSQGFAWQNARDNYFKGLTTTTREDHDKLLAAVFQTLGQLIHLPQDGAVPAHTRSDQHLFFEGFERSVENLRAGNADQVALFNQLTQNPIGFDPSILKLPQNPLAPLPIARIIDTTDPEQAAALPSAGTNQGLAEYSNANFLSGDTIFKNFAFPRLESIDVNFPLTVNNRRYYTKIADGETNFFLVAEGTFTEKLLSLLGDKGFVLDPRVYQDYASYLLPRAIGYSAGFLDYFFRGRIEVNNIQTPGQTPGSPVTSVQVSVKNTTPDKETGSGEVTAVATFTAGGQQFFAVSSSQTVNLTRDFQDVVFDFSQSPIPPDAPIQSLLVVYRGPLGLEEGAVVAQQIGKCPVQGQPGTFTTIDFPNADRTTAFGVNNCGKVVGSFQDATGGHGFVLSEGVFTQIDPPNSWWTDAYGINDSDQIVGYGYFDWSDWSRGFLFSEGVFTTIDAPGAMMTWAYGINNAGQVVGGFSADGWSVHGFLLSGGVFTTIDGPNSSFTYASGINDAGQIVGTFSDATGIHGFVLSEGVFTQIDVPGAMGTYASGINNTGQIVGAFTDVAWTGHGFVLSEGVLTQIDPPNSWWTQASGINSPGQIVGVYVDTEFRTHGFLRNSP